MESNNPTDKPQGDEGAKPSLGSGKLEDNEQKNVGKREHATVFRQKPRSNRRIGYYWREHRIELLDLAIGVLNLIMTGVFIYVAVIQNHAAEESNDLTRSVIYTDSMQRIDDSVENAKRFRLDSVSSDSQIHVLSAQVNAMKDQFTIENAPLLTMGNTQLRNLIYDDYLTVVYEVANLGKLPTKILRVRRTISYLKKFDVGEMKKILRTHKTPVSFDYVGGNGVRPFTDIARSDKIISDSLLREYEKEKRVAYFFGEILYQNIQNNDTSRYFFVADITRFKDGSSVFGFRVQENERLNKRL
jgi:hypothetical protein